MKVGRNDPCPCGSGKKYKKCCLLKEPPAFVQAPATSAAPEPDEQPVEADWGEPEAPVETPSVQPEILAEEPQPRETRQYPRPNEQLPKLPPEQEQIIEDWWNETAPLFKRGEVDRLLQRVETALTGFPDLFVHLALHQEFLFELGAGLARRGRMPEYIALLKRLRREQRQMYSFSYGAYDSDVIAELAINGQPDEIPAYLDLFKEYPDAQPDYCHQICDLLAWRGLGEPLYLLCEAVATPMLTSSKVVGGNFAMDWLIRREEIRFFEAGDASPDAVNRAVQAISQLGERLQFALEPNAEWLSSGWQACLEPPMFETRSHPGDKAARQVAMNFTSHLCRGGKASWLQALFLSGLLLDYFGWCRRQKKPWARLQRKDVESFAVYRSRSLIYVVGVPLLASLQCLAWFADYLGAAAIISAAEVERVKQDCGRLFEQGRRVLDSTDPAYRLCPTYEQLIAQRCA